MGAHPKYDHTEILIMHLDYGMSGYEIADQLKAPRQTINEIIRRCIGYRNPPKPREPTEQSIKTWQHAAKVAGQWHLIDLKRAGHSPRFTEIRNPPDSTGKRFTTLACSQSLYGSPAASCAEWAQ